MENKQAVSVKTRRWDTSTFSDTFSPRQSVFRHNHKKHIDKIKKLRYTKLRCHGPVQHQHYSFSKVCAYGDTRKRKPFMCDNMYTECEKRKQNIPTIPGTFCFLYCLFALCNSHLFYPSSPIYSTNLIIVVHSRMMIGLCKPLKF